MVAVVVKVDVSVVVMVLVAVLVGVVLAVVVCDVVGVVMVHFRKVPSTNDCCACSSVFAVRAHFEASSMYKKLPRPSIFWDRMAGLKVPRL